MTLSVEDALYARISASAAGRGLCGEALRRLCRETAWKYKKLNDAEKAVKTLLHQMTGMFLSAQEAKNTRRFLEDPSLTGKELSLRLLAQHASSRERLETLEAFYDAIYERIGPAESVLDIGCGFNPAALPWMRIREPVTYHACDVSLTTVELVNRYFARCSLPPRAFGYDVLSGGPLPQADVAYVFKLLPLLDQQQKGGFEDFLNSLPVQYAVVTFPLRTLSGRSVGMETFYQNRYLPRLKVCSVQLDEYTLGDEWVCVLKK